MVHTPDPNKKPSADEIEKSLTFAGENDASAMPEPAAPAASDAEATPSSFEIEWFDEEKPPAEGHLFTEPPPEPPLRPFEIVHEPKPARQTAKRGDTAPAASAAASFRPVSSRPPLWIRLIWGFMPVLLLVGGYASVILTQRGIGYAWDEAFYYEPSLNAADWLTEILHGQRPFDQARIDKYWGDLHEHPSVQKFLSGLALRVFPDREPLRTMRLPIAVLFGLSLSLIYLLGRRTWGPVPGLIAALLYLTMPRIFGHAHFASMETPLIFMMLLVVFCFLRGLDSTFWAILTGLTFGLLLATKINGFFLPIPLILWGQLYARRRYINNLFAMLTLGPLVFVAAWPWLWPDPVMRTLGYLAFHAQHQLTALYFMGTAWGYGHENAPWFYPSVIIAVTLPLSALFLIGWGLLRTLVALPRRPIGALYLLCALVMLGVASAPATPRYDGARLFLPVFPFLALLGGAGAVGLIALIQRLTQRRGHLDPIRQRKVLRWSAAALGLIILLDGGLSIWRYQPYLLSYFNPLVGGLKGAAAKGFETTYWGEALNEQVIASLNRLPSGSSVMPLALHELCLRHLQMWGDLKPDLRIVNESQAPADYHLLLYRRGFFQRPERALADSGVFPGQIWDKWGVPMIGLFQTGEPFERFWRTLPPGRGASLKPAQAQATH